MDFYPAQILLPYGWSRPVRPHYKVLEEKRAAIKIRYRNETYELQAHKPLDRNQLTLFHNEQRIGEIEWSAPLSEVIVDDLEINPDYRGRGLAKLLAWAALRQAREAGCLFEQARAERIMEEEDDLQVDPRAAKLFAELGFNGIDRDRQEHAANLVWLRSNITVSGSQRWPHYKIESPIYGIGTLRLALMLPEGSRLTERCSRGILQNRVLYQSLLHEENGPTLAHVILRGAIYLSGDYSLNPAHVGALTEEVDQMPALGI